MKQGAVQLIQHFEGETGFEGAQPAVSWLFQGSLYHLLLYDFCWVCMGLLYVPFGGVKQITPGGGVVKWSVINQIQWCSSEDILFSESATNFHIPWRSSPIWGFPKMLVPNNHGLSYQKWSFWGVLEVPPFKETPIFILQTALSREHSVDRWYLWLWPIKSLRTLLPFGQGANVSFSAALKHSLIGLRWFLQHEHRFLEFLASRWFNDKIERRSRSAMGTWEVGNSTQRKI